MTSSREILYGRRTILETLRAGRRAIHELLLAEPLRGAIVRELRAEAVRRRIPIRTCPKSELDRLTRGGHHQGAALVVGPYPYVDPESMREAAERAGEPLLILFLDHIHDPQNLGSLLRTAEALGVHGVLLPQDRAAHVTPAVARASSGASEHIRVAIVPSLADAIREWKARGLWVVGLENIPAAVALPDARLNGPLGIVIGNEGEGLSRGVARACDVLARIPIRGCVESLNAAISGALALYEALRQRRVHGAP